jgi:hypothetical protein
MDFEAEDDEDCYYFGRECMKIYVFKNQLLIEGAVAQNSLRQNAESGFGWVMSKQFGWISSSKATCIPLHAGKLFLQPKGWIIAVRNTNS